jgi:hypothetical protein
MNYINIFYTNFRNQNKVFGINHLIVRIARGGIQNLK